MLLLSTRKQFKFTFKGTAVMLAVMKIIFIIVNTLMKMRLTKNLIVFQQSNREKIIKTAKSYFPPNCFILVLLI